MQRLDEIGVKGPYEAVLSPDHYYSYLYTALYIKEIEAQWERAGFPLTDKPDIVITLFNIGFERSNPNAAPAAGGASWP